MKASKFLKLKARLQEASNIVVEAAKEVSVVVEKAVEEVVKDSTPIVEAPVEEVKSTKKKVVKDA
jgi:hypothetical protein